MSPRLGIQWNHLQALDKSQRQRLFLEFVKTGIQAITGPTKTALPVLGIVGCRVQRAPAVMVFELVQRRFEEAGDETFAGLVLIVQTKRKKMCAVQAAGGLFVFGPFDRALMIGGQLVP